MKLLKLIWLWIKLIFIGIIIAIVAIKEEIKLRIQTRRNNKNEK